MEIKGWGGQGGSTRSKTKCGAVLVLQAITCRELKLKFALLWVGWCQPS